VVSCTRSSIVMNSWTQLAVELSASERKIAETQRRAEKAVQRSEERVKAVTAKQAELDEQHQANIEDIVRRNRVRLDALTRRAEEGIAAAEAATQEADKKTLQVEKQKSEFQAQAKVLEQEVQELYLKLAQTREEHELRYNEAVQSAQTEAEEALEVGRLKIRDTSNYATEARDGVNDLLDGMRDAKDTALLDVHARSEQRSRYQAYTTLAMHKTELEGEQLTQARHGLLQDWLDDWNKSLPMIKPPNSSTRMSPRVAPLRDKEELKEAVATWKGSTPTPPKVVRAKDRATEQASRGQQSARRS